MGKVTEHLVRLLTKQVEEHGVVVWYDPGGVSAGIVQGPELSGLTVLRFDKSFFRLREQIEPYLELVDADGLLRPDPGRPPRLLVYVPRSRESTANALIEVESAGTVVEPGANPWQRNTRLGLLVEHVFKRLAPDRAGDLARQADQGTLSLEDLDRLAEETEARGVGVLQLLFGTAAPLEIALSFASSPERDEALHEKEALPELVSLVSASLGVEIGDSSPEEARGKLRRALLLGDLVASLPAKDIPKELLAVELPSRRSHLEALQKACGAWRNRADLRGAYADAAREVERDARLADLDLRAESLVEVETFAVVEDRLLAHAERSILDGRHTDALALTERRRRGFWPSTDPACLLQWSLLETACRLLDAAARVQADLRSAGKPAAAMISAYTASEAPWCLLDTYHRHLERQYAAFDLDVTGGHDLLEQVIQRVRRRYAEVAGISAEAFTSALEAARFEVEGLLRHDEVFAKVVAPKRAASKVAYVWVDALRYEMARELVEGLAVDFEVALQPAMGQLPTITEVGMGALVPGAERGMDLVDAGGGKLAVRVGGTVLKDRASRLRHLREAVGGKAIDLKLNDLIKPGKKLKEEIGAADFLLVTSQEIDRLGEGADAEDETRRYIDEVLDKLRRGVRRLAALGVPVAVIAADHGYLYGEPIESGMKMDPPGGKTVDLHRRVWVGKGGGSGDGYLRLSASQIGLGGDLELALPRGLGCFKAAGSTSFFHGGASLPEVVIPVVTLTARAARAAETSQSPVRLEMERPRVTTRLFSVIVTYAAADLFAPPERRVRVVVRAERQEVGGAATAAYGYEPGTREVLLRKGEPNAVTLLLESEVAVLAVSVHVLDAVTQVELGRKEDIAVTIRM